MTRMVEFGDLVVEDNRLIDVLDEVEYACGGVRLNGNGVFIREYKRGVDLKKKFVQHVLKPGDIVYSTLFAKAGAFAVAESDVEGIVLSEKFPTFRLINGDVSLDYLRWFFRSGQLNRIAESQATGIAAFSLSHLSKQKFLKLKVPVPSAERQAEVVSLCTRAAAAAESAVSPARRNAKLAQHLVGIAAARAFSSMPRVRISDIGEYILRPVEIQPERRYSQVTVAMKNRGLRRRRICEGSDIKSPGQSYVMEGDILFSRIDLWQGAIGVVSKDLEGSVVTRDFPVFRLKENDEVTRQLMRYVFRTPEFETQAREVSRGTTGRKKMKRPAFLRIEVPWCEPTRRSDILRDMEEVERQCTRLTEQAQKQESLARQMGHSLVASLYARDAGLI